MRQALRVWVKITLYISIWVLFFNLMSDIKTSHGVKQSLILAVHDATLQVDETALSRGMIIFDKEKAKEVFVDSLEYNTNLTYRTENILEPENNPFYQENFKIVSLEFLDHSTTSFPIDYSHPLYDFKKTYYGPTIIAVIETESPRFFVGSKKVIRRSSSYTYKITN